MLLVNGRKPRESGDCLISSGVQWRRKKLEEWTAETRTGSWMHGWRTRGSYSLLPYIPFTRPNCLIFLPSWHGGLTHVAHAHSSATRKLEDCGGALLKSRPGELFFSSHRNPEATPNSAFCSPQHKMLPLSFHLQFLNIQKMPSLFTTWHDYNLSIHTQQTQSNSAVLF